MVALILTGFNPSVSYPSISGFLLIRVIILLAESWAFWASGAKDVALPMDSAVKTTAANTLQKMKGIYYNVIHNILYIIIIAGFIWNMAAT